ncbi:MAG: iron-containing alcohol dehydrogenase [Alphaproteobacteria bacterium]|nr:iron-containing alcohol dehydrogenase [Alphaproteobacteria bacterium]MCW5740793.1 iron-containing alcohol dehydrogenase [Alphaproteobacteria bacterium]
MDGGTGFLAEAVRAAAVTRHVAVGAGALNSLAAAAAVAPGHRRLVVIADDNTFAAAGRAADAILRGAGLAVAEPIVMPGAPRLKPHVYLAQNLAARLDGGTIPLAVGSGVVGDLVKYAASLAGRPYLCAATAASMDGYAASGAALLDGCFKRTFDCPPPLAVVADLDVIAQAPPAMASWGYGDLAGKVVAGADWLLADALGEDAINPGPFAMVQDRLTGWLGDPAGLRSGDRGALHGLVSGLLVSGFAMQAHGNSRPASGSDHQFAHLWEMGGLSVGGERVSHGVCVGIGCVVMLALYEWLLAQDRPVADIDAVLAAQPRWPTVEQRVRSAFSGTALADRAVAEMAAKRRDPARLRQRLRRFVEIWPGLRERLGARLPAPAAMRAALAACGAPSTPEAIGVMPGKLRADIERARMIRRRYTLLDLLADAGLLERAIHEVFGNGSDTGREA